MSVLEEAQDKLSKFDLDYKINRDPITYLYTCTAVIDGQTYSASSLRELQAIVQVLRQLKIIAKHKN